MFSNVSCLTEHCFSFIFLCRVPENKQSMFLPEIMEEDDDNNKFIATPRTSSASLANHLNDSPDINRR